MAGKTSFIVCVTLFSQVGMQPWIESSMFLLFLFHPAHQ